MLNILNQKYVRMLKLPNDIKKLILYYINISNKKITDEIYMFAISYNALRMMCDPHATILKYDN